MTSGEVASAGAAPVPGGVGWFNSLPSADAEQQVLACCASPVWAAAVVSGRPYASAGALVQHSTRILGNLPWEQVLIALAAHPRIGQAPAGDGREAGWSRREQAGAANPDEVTRAALAEANRAYEQRFDHVFLIFATGRTDAEMLAEARRRLGNDERAERATVRDELARIAALRLERTLG